jgi:glucose/arabinose dehydrogenase
MNIDQPFANHNGGLLLFGPDDLLYIGLGDGGGADDQDRRAQDLSDLLGKILRIDPAPAGGRQYSVPADNPFADEADARGEIYSYGLRNPWRFSFDRETGDLAIGDVGQEEQEEVDLVARGQGSGANFGWSAYEGENRFNEDQEAPGAIPPVLVATHEDGNCSITGGVVVRDRDLPTLYGRYVWGDFCLGALQSFTAKPGRPATDNRPLGLDVESLSSFGEDNAGNVYAVSLSGPVYRLDPAS